MSAKTTFNFPYSINDEPTLDWTIEQVIHWDSLKSLQEADAHFDRLRADLLERWEVTKAQLIRNFEEHVNNGDNVNNRNKLGGEKVVAPASVVKATPAKPAPATSAVKDQQPLLRVEIISSEADPSLTGTFFTLAPKRAPCVLGRGTLKKIRERGISVPQDTEISTQHGKFELLQGMFYYTDLKSTNGSYISGNVTPLIANERYLLENGMDLLFGSTIFRIHIAK